MNLPPTPPPPFAALYQQPVDPNATLDRDAPCRKCAYNLRGLSAAGRCPECGTPVGLSIHGDLLRYSDPQWLEMLVKGLTFILWGIVVVIVVNVLGGLVRTPIPPSWIGIFAGLLAVYGAWLVTEPDPSGLGEAQYATSRKLVRAALLVGLGHQVLEAISNTFVLPEWLRPTLVIIGIAAGLAGVVGEFAKFVYLEKLALRLPNDQLARRARVIRFGLGITLAALVVFAGIAAIAGPGTGPPATRGPLVGLVCVAGLALLCFLIFGIMALIFYIRMRRALIEQTSISRQVWGAAYDASVQAN
jgi:FtsH-binding integral membrane protein